MPAVARVTDMHTCPMVTEIVPHVGGPILPPGRATVLAEWLPVATVGDQCVCVGPPDVIAAGSPTVFAEHLPVARVSDTTVHGGVIVAGSRTVLANESGKPR